MPHVVVLSGPAAGATHPIAGGSIIIGRVGDSGTAEMTIPDGRVSRLHARICNASGAWTLRDLGSRNGGLVDGEPFAPNEERPLGDGAVIRLGETLLVFHTRPH